VGRTVDVELAAARSSSTPSDGAAREALFGPTAGAATTCSCCRRAFPFGGMENPRLTFATPTILAGDKSLVG
jgi:leukotriene-A4 hydrolase